jgi:HAMP domain-containing protein
VTALDLDPDLVALIAIGAAVVALIVLVLAVVLAVRIRRMRRQYVVLQAGDDGQSFLDAVSRQNDEVVQLRSEVASLRSSVDTLRVDLADAIRHVAVVRYDAFNDMGGRMSFSAALLDDAGDGVVISSINGRSETRTYAKGVKGGISEADLSPEEVQVIGYARASHPRS